MEMESLKIGDHVRTETGELGTVVHMARQTVFVQLESEPEDSSVKAFLVSQLTKVEPPRPPPAISQSEAEG